MLYSDFSLLYNEILDKNNLSEYKTEGFCQKFYDFYNLIVEFNAHTNITAITDAKEVILKHFADCMHVAKLIPEGECKLIDVGCGGGFPSLPIAILRSDIKITSLDSTSKKIDFVNLAANKLGLTNIKGIAARAEEYIKNTGASYDYCTSRAVARLNILSELCIPYLEIDGVFLAMKAKSGQDELDEALSGIKKLGGEYINTVSFEIHGENEDFSRNIIVVEKRSKTPAAYPRRYGQILKKPL